MRDLDDAAEAVRSRLTCRAGVPETLATVDGRDLFTTASVGVAIAAPSHRLRRPAPRGRHGDVRRQERRAVTGWSVFNEDLRAAVTARLAIEADLRQALDRRRTRGLVPAGGRPGEREECMAVEALLRWHHPDGDCVGRGPFRQRRRGDRARSWTSVTGSCREACPQAAEWAASRADQPLHREGQHLRSAAGRGRPADRAG